MNFLNTGKKKRTVMHQFTCYWKKMCKKKTKKNQTILNENTSCPCGNTGECWTRSHPYKPVSAFYASQQTAKLCNK